MARRSILWPPKLSGGRLVMTPDPDLADLEDANVELRQIIGVSLLPGENNHPFNDPAEIGIRDPTYQGASRAQQAQIRARVRDVFARLQRERRARLVEVSFRREVVDDLSSLIVRIEYENLETGGRLALESTLNG